MMPLVLTREALAVIQGAIDRNGGEITVRNLFRNHFLAKWEIEQAEEGGFIALAVRKPKRGRPSLVARKVSENHTTKLPPRRADLESLISWRHWRFACHYVMGEHGPGWFSFRRRAYIAYQKAFPAAKSKAGARASASRLLRKPHIRAAIQWTFARINLEIIYEGPDPATTFEIWDTLQRLGNWRAQWAP